MATESKYSSFRNSGMYQNSNLGFLDWFSSMFNTMTTDSRERDIANENLEYQKERNKIEDARYEDETKYNREFIEGERDYQRALQQQIFDREDTAFSRQASDLASIGINPLSQGSLNGAGAGQAVSAVAEPGLSSRGGTALHNDYSPSEVLNNSVTPILSLINGINNISTSGFQRDLLRQESDSVRLKNQEQALINARRAKQLAQEEELREENIRHLKEENPNIERKTKASANREEREDKFQEVYGGHDSQSTYNAIATDMAMQADRAYNYTNDQIGGYSKSALNTLKANADKAIESYNKVTQRIQDGIVNGFKAGRDKIKSWKKYFMSPEEMERAYSKR